MSRRGTGWLVGVIVLLGLLWVGYWYAAHYAAETAIARAGVRGVGCSGGDLTGFPLQLDLPCAKAIYASANNAATGAIAGFTTHAPI